MAASLVSTSRTRGQLRGVLARLALAASQIAACYERYGPDQPWGFADPTSWKCGAALLPRVGHMSGRQGALVQTKLRRKQP